MQGHIDAHEKALIKPAMKINLLLYFEYISPLNFHIYMVTSNTNEALVLYVLLFCCLIYRSNSNNNPFDFRLEMYFHFLVMYAWCFASIDVLSKYLSSFSAKHELSAPKALMHNL